MTEVRFCSSCASTSPSVRGRGGGASAGGAAEAFFDLSSASTCSSVAGAGAWLIGGCTDAVVRDSAGVSQKSSSDAAKAEAFRSLLGGAAAACPKSKSVPTSSAKVPNVSSFTSSFASSSC